MGRNGKEKEMQNKEKKKRRIDLHIHTVNSDGKLSPIEVIEYAKENNISTISITDHDSIDSYTDEVIRYAKESNVNLVYGVEISTKYNGIGMHILGYNIDINNKVLCDTLNRLKKSRIDYLNNVNDKLKSLGYYLEVSKLKQLEVVTKAHIANDIVGNIKNHDLLIKCFNHIPNKGEFIESVLNEGCPAYVKKDSITPIDAAKIIRNANGLVVIAHPMAYTYEDNLSDEDIINYINEIKPDGIEANYIYIDRYNNKINEIDKWNNIAKKLNLFTTVGSDFHSFDNVHPVIGLLNENIDIEDNGLKID